MLASFVYALISTHDSEEIATKHRDLIMSIHKLRQKKFKTKQDMELLMVHGKRVVQDELRYVKTFMQWKLVAGEMHRLNPFYRADRFRIPAHIDNFNSRKKEAEPEERTIKAFTQILNPVGESDIPLCMETMMVRQKVTGLEESSEKNFHDMGVLKLEMFRLPGFLSFKASKFQLLRDELMPELDQWWQALHETLKALTQVQFKKDNVSQIRDTVLTLLKPAADALRQKTEHSIYLQQLANDELGEYRSTFSFAVNSLRNMLHAYHDTNQMNDGVLQAVENYFGARNELDKIACFLLHEVPEYPPFKIYSRSDHEYLEGAWKESMES